MVGAVTAVLIGIDQEIGYRFYRVNVTKGSPLATDEIGGYRNWDIRISDIFLYGSGIINGVPSSGYASINLDPLNTLSSAGPPHREAPNLFDGNGTTFDSIVVYNQLTNPVVGQMTQRVGSFNFQFVRPVILTGYGIRPSDADRGPGNWTFQGSKNGTDWVTLHTQNNVNNWALDSNFIGITKNYSL